MNRLQVVIEKALEVTGASNSQAGLRNSNALMNRLQLATGEALEVTGASNNQAGLRNPRVTCQPHAASTGAAIVAAVEVADFQDLLAEIVIMVVGIPVGPADQGDPDNILLLFS